MKSLRSRWEPYRVLAQPRTACIHWWLQRLTSIALVPLTIWFTVSILVRCLDGPVHDHCVDGTKLDRLCS